VPSTVVVYEKQCEGRGSVTIGSGAAMTTLLGIVSTEACGDDGLEVPQYSQCKKTKSLGKDGHGVGG
jgi:hypothetical protein